MEEKVRRALAPSQEEIAALPVKSNAEAARDLIGPIGGRALDIGCGDGAFTRAIAGLFDAICGIDVKENKIEQARRAAASAGSTAEFRAASAEAIPTDDAAFGVVIFSNSLHHMPNIEAALAEALRVLRPGGFLYVMEPVASGDYYEATKLVNDEREVRAQAYDELVRLPARGATPGRESLYRQRRSFANLEEWIADQIDRDPKRKASYDAQPAEVRRRFEAYAQRVDGRLAFDQAFRVNLFEKTGA